MRPITPVEVYTYARSVALQASSGAIIDYIGGAQPPTVEPVGVRRSATTTEPSFDLAEFAEADLGLVDEASLASNGWAIGKDRVAGNDGGVLLANPHFPWEGELRFSEFHLTVPGEADIYGAQLLGLPGIGIGFTEGVAWTHTVSAGKRMTGYNLTLDPASPTSYLVDGVSVPMTSTEVAIDILRGGRHRRHRDAYPVAQRVRPDPRLPRHRLDQRPTCSPIETPTSTTTSSSSSTHGCR